MKIILLFLAAFVLTDSPADRSTPVLAPGTWGGLLKYGEQTTAFYLDLRLNDDEEVTAYLSLPVTSLYERRLGLLEASDSLFTAGAVQFTLSAQGDRMTGTLTINPRQLNFTLAPVPHLPERKPETVVESTAAPVWTFTTGGAVWGDAATDGETVYIGSTDSTLYALDAATGTLKWAYQTGGPVYSRPVIHNGYLYILSDGGHLHKLNAESAELVWKFDTGSAEWHRGLPDHEQPGYDTMSSAPVISDGVVYTGSPDGHFYAIDDRSGTEIWKFETGAPVLSVPVASGNTLYFGSNDHHVYALDAASGHLKWKFDTGQVVNSTPVIHGDLLIIGSRSADLFALNLETGKPAWSSFYWFSWVESSGAIYDNTLYIGSSDIQTIQSLNPHNGSLNWSFDTGGSPWTTPAVTEETVFTGAFGNSNYFIAHRGGFFAVDRHSGTEKWRYTMNEREGSHIYGVVSSPAVAGGMVFFGGLDSVVYGFSVDGKSSAQ